jgi:hypothetical protein
MKEIDLCDHVLVYSKGQEALAGLQAMVKEGKILPSLIFFRPPYAHHGRLGILGGLFKDSKYR